MGPKYFKPGEAKGAPWHPHRGFQTVTYLLSGEMHHQDSMGNQGFLRSGDVQWMVAGEGIIHDETPSPAYVEKGGTMHGFQLWVNLPKTLKMCPPDYQDVPSSKLPVVQLEKASVKIIAGNFNGVEGVVSTRVPTQYLDCRLEADTTLEHTYPGKFNAFVYVYEGTVLFGEKGETKVHRGYMGIFEVNKDGNNTFRAQTLSETGPAKFLFIAGEPLNEPISRRGPFVMNTKEEIYQAFDDYQSGKFGKKKGTVTSKTDHDTPYVPDK